MKTVKSDISGQQYPAAECVSARIIRKSLQEFIRQEHPQFNDNSFLSVSELNTYREKYIADYLVKQLGELTELEKSVLASVSDKTILSGNEDFSGNITLGQKVADRVATFGGSWTFIILFGLFILAWIAANVYWLANRGFDPYPFILLNLILSCLAALQAPIIMMSQNRQEEKDRERAKKDYMVNLKSELEIRLLHEKLDHLIMHQQQELLEIQRIQIEMMNDILQKVETKGR
ncbi:MAG: DUF1003 domain-containing protein [Taibaiella sp.]|nr:DUF1003 domain-containing protein [Taibaiella sp.]